MPNNPVQIVLNDTDFHQAPDPGQPPRPKDFFENENRAFAAHRDSLAGAIQAIIEEVAESPYGNATYLRVQMRTEAVAKSYRPVEWLFQADQFPCVGAEAVGTLYFRAPLMYLSRLRARIEEAETTVRTAIRQRDGKPYPAPTVKRAEVGAIESIEITPPSAKRTFSTAAAMQLFTDPATVSGYQIELFEAFDADVIADDPTGRTALFRSLQRLFVSFGPGTRAFLASKLGRTPVLEFQLTRDEAPAIVDNRLGLIRGDSAPPLPPARIDDDASRHEATLNSLQGHPLIRAIRPPVRLQLVDEGTDFSGGDVAGGAALSIPEPAQNATYPIVGIIDSGVSTILDPWVVERFDYLGENDYEPDHGTMVAGLVALAGC